MFESFKKDKPETGGRPSAGRKGSGRTAQSNVSRSSQQRMPRNITGRRGDGKFPVHRGEGKNTVDDTVKSGQGQFIDPRQMRTRNTVEE
ncbi:MAG: cell division protein, partial [Scardovia wiggsiae]